MIDTTIIVPIYNVEPYLPDFFTSLAEQTYQGFRLVIIDDASSDSSYEIAKYLSEPFGDRVTVYRNELNLGLSGARNAGLDIACCQATEYITFLDPDDVLEPDYLDDLHSTAIMTGAGLVVSGIVRFDDATGKIICTEMVGYPHLGGIKASECDDLAYINPCSYAKLYRFSGIEALRFRPIKRSEDTCYLFEALPALGTIAFTNKALYRYRVRSDSLSGSIGADKLSSMHEVFANVLNEFSSPDFEPYREMFEAQVFIRSSVGGVTRLSFKDMSAAGKLSSREIAWLDVSMPLWKRNKYLSFGRWRSKTSKQFALKVSASLYKAHAFPLFIYLYYIVSVLLKKEVRA